MKSISALLTVALFATLSAQAQQGNEPMPRPRILPPQPGVQVWPGQAPGVGGVREAGPELPESNFTISLEGSMSANTVVDLQLTGSGPTFNADQLLGEHGPVLSCEYKLSKTERGYRVSYSIGVQVRIATSVVRGEKETTNYEHRDVSFSGAVLCTPGVPVVIARSGGKPLMLTLAEVPVPVVPAVEKAAGNPPVPENGH